MLEDEIRELEERLTLPEARGSADEIERVISDQFIEFGSSGRTYTKRDVIAQIMAAPNVTIDIAAFQVLTLAQDVVLATYRTPGSLRSSIWRREGDCWRIVFHQGTPIGIGS